MTGAVVVVTGIRDLILPASGGAVVGAMGTLLTLLQWGWADAWEVRFGGAEGVDTLALSAALARLSTPTLPRCCLAVYTPGPLNAQPTDARTAIEGAMAAGLARLVEHAGDEGPHAHSRGRANPLVRNERMLDGGDRLPSGEQAPRATFVLGFKDQRTFGGTYSTLCHAARRGIPHLVVPVRGWRGR